MRHFSLFMLKPPNKIIVIIGPTASGKSELAVRLAKKINGEIISADSRQVYRGLTIGTGKVPGKWKTFNRITTFFYKSIPHYAIDYVSPKKQYTVAEYKKYAEKIIKKIYAHGKIPILVGGTGFWIDAIVYGLTIPNIPPNKKLRATLERKKTASLFQMLVKIDPERAKNIDAKNPRRLIRAIEIASTLGQVPVIKKRNQYNTLWIGIEVPSNILREKIEKRLDQRLKHGMIEESKKLHESGLPWKRLYALGLEYRFLADFLQKKTTKEEMQKNLSVAIWRYAKRQITWWKKNKEIRWITRYNQAEILVKTYLKNASSR